MSDTYYDDFGSGDAQRDIARSEDALESLFIETEGIRNFLLRDQDIPFLVGSKGAGKSLLLFKKYVQITRKSGVLYAPGNGRRAYAPTKDFADTVKWAPFWKLLDDSGHAVLESWAVLWEWALLSSALSTILAHCRPPQLDEKTRRACERLLSGVAHQDPFHWLHSYLSQMEDPSTQVLGKLVLPKPEPLRDLLVDHVADFPPVYIFIDHHDDYFQEHPEFWIASNCGCFAASRAIAASTNQRIHFLVTLRPEVYWRLAENQDFSKWESEFFTIWWNDRNLVDMFTTRAKLLKRHLLRAPEFVATDPLRAFVGNEFWDEGTRRCIIANSVVRPESRDGEPLMQYLIRHTLRRPRDLIAIGNEIIRSRADMMGADAQSILRHAVNVAASRVIGESYMGEVSARWPWDGHNTMDGIRTLLASIGKNILSRKEAEKVQAKFAKAHRQDVQTCHPLCTLASFGLIGWPIQDKNTGGQVQYFLRPGERRSIHIPASAQWILVHPILYGEPYHIAAVEGQVVGAGLPFDSRKVGKVSTAEDT